MQHGDRVKGLAGEDNLSAMCHDGEHTEYEAETVEEWRRAAENVHVRKCHAVADETGVVNEVASPL